MADNWRVYFKYDPFERRIYKSSSSGASVFAYDLGNLVEETNSTGGVVARYAQADNLDEPMAMLRSGATSYYESDGLGTITSLSNSAGALAQTYTFDSFGNTTVQRITYEPIPVHRAGIRPRNEFLLLPRSILRSSPWPVSKRGSPRSREGRAESICVRRQQSDNERRSLGPLQN